jgi:hypothetical protein
MSRQRRCDLRRVNEYTALHCTSEMKAPWSDPDLRELLALYSPPFLP